MRGAKAPDWPPARLPSPKLCSIPSYLIILPLLLTTIHGAQLDQATSEPPKQETGPRIVIQPNEPVFHINTQDPSSRALTCSTEGDAPGAFSELKWSGPNSRDNWDELSKRHSITEEVAGNNVWFLEFKNPTVDDAGTYYCHSIYHSSEKLSAAIRVKVTTPIKLENCPDRQFLVLGGTSTKITCRISAETPRVSLYKNENAIERSNTRYKWDNDDGLVINGEVEYSDAGRYKVVVRSQLTGELKTQYIDVEVHSKPQILASNNSNPDFEFFGIEGEQVQLECKVSGNPRPFVYWLDPKLRNLTQVGGYVVNPERGTLQINRANKVDDHGQFTCVATNTVGTESRKISMNVDTRPTILSFENKTADEGTEVTFECRSTGDPRPTFSIRKHGISQQPYRVGDGLFKDEVVTPETGGSDVHVHRLTIVAAKSHFGLHYCNATNRAGTAERVGQLTVNYKPDLTQTPPEQYVRMGKRITVTCHIRAYPAPKITWWSDTIQIVNVESSVKVSTDGQTHIVTMMPPADQQTPYNRFVCQAENTMGRAEQTIIPRYTTRPSVVQASMIERLPTSVKLNLFVPSDGGDRIKAFKYRLEGRTLDMHNPLYSYRIDKQNETIIDASLNPSSVYTIRNLLPYFSYKITIRAVNDVGDGDESDISFDTLKPTKPDQPVIIKPTPALLTNSASGVPSEYQNGYVLKWSPPESDNGDPITKYIIKYNRVDTNSLDIDADSGSQKIVEQMNERPMHARIGPLQTNSRYRIEIRARNKYGDSDPAQVTIYTTPDRPSMPEFESQTLAWLMEPSTPTLFALLALGILMLVLIDLVFCSCFHMGVSYMIRSWCCASKANSVISDKAYA